MSGNSDRGLRILLVEDQPANAYLFREFLARAPGIRCAEILVVDRLSRALELLSREAVDLVFLDLGLPDSYGLPTFETLHVAHPGVPVVVLSGSVDPRTEQAVLDRGAAAFLNKADSFPGSLSRAIQDALLVIPELR